ncbi:MAG: YdcF family protein [Hyphomicrobiaceae bacterium]
MYTYRTFVRLVLGVAGLAIASLVLGFLFFAEFATRQGTAEVETADAIVVLTGGSRRLREAGRLLQAGKARHLLISGVNRQTSPAKVRELAAINHDKFDCCVTLGYFAKNTRGNAVEARNWLRGHSFTSLIVVTSSYHMPRSLTELALAMPKVRLIPHPVKPDIFLAKPWWMHGENARILAQEYLKFLPSAASLAVNRILKPGASAASMNGGSVYAGTNS